MSAWLPMLVRADYRVDQVFVPTRAGPPAERLIFHQRPVALAGPDGHRLEERHQQPSEFLVGQRQELLQLDPLLHVAADIQTSDPLRTSCQ